MAIGIFHGVQRSLKEKHWSLKWEYNHRVYNIAYGIINILYYAIIQHRGTYSSILSRFLIPLEGHLLRKRSCYTLNYLLPHLFCNSRFIQP